MWELLLAFLQVASNEMVEMYSQHPQLMGGVALVSLFIASLSMKAFQREVPRDSSSREAME